MAKPQCWDSSTNELVHKGFTDTGATKYDKPMGIHFRIFRCQCGQKTMEVYPKGMAGKNRKKK